MEQELDVEKTKCLTLKSEINCAMDVCRKGQMDVKGYKETFDTHEQITPLFKNQGSVPSVEYCNCKFEITATNEIANCNSHQWIRSVEQKTGINSSEFNFLRKAICTPKYLYFYRYLCFKPKSSIFSQKKHQRCWYRKVWDFEGGNAKRITQRHDYTEDSVR